MWVMRLLGQTGTKSIEPVEEKRLKYFKQICNCELEIEEINNQITELEKRREEVENRLDVSAMIYSNLVTE